MAISSGWVTESQYTDTNGIPMLMIGSGHYPRPLAKAIAEEILKILDEKTQDNTNAE